LAHVVQLLGMMAGSPAQPPDLAEFGFLIIAMRTDLMMPEAEYRNRATEYADAVRAARPMSGGDPVRMPFDRSAEVRRKARARDIVDMPDLVHERLQAMAERGPEKQP
jgi:LDH2 family malate/lactate/ureidoglycolate dehydrogenase